MIPTKVVLFVALFFLVGATDVDENSGAQKKVEQNGMVELMAGETVIHSRAVKGEDELAFIDPINYRSKRSGPPNASKYF